MVLAALNLLAVSRKTMTAACPQVLAFLQALLANTSISPQKGPSALGEGPAASGCGRTASGETGKWDGRVPLSTRITSGDKGSGVASEDPPPQEP